MSESESQTFATLRDLFSIKETIGGLQSGFSILTRMVEKNRDEGNALMEKLSDRIEAGLGQIRAELSEESRQTEARTAKKIEDMETRVLNMLNGVSADVKRALETAHAVKTDVTISGAVADAADAAAEKTESKVKQTFAPFMTHGYRAIVILLLLLVAGRDAVPGGLKLFGFG